MCNNTEHGPDSRSLFEPARVAILALRVTLPVDICVRVRSLWKLYMSRRLAKREEVYQATAGPDPAGRETEQSDYSTSPSHYCARYSAVVGSLHLVFRLPPPTCVIVHTVVQDIVTYFKFG